MAHCGHETGEAFGVCRHLRDDEDLDHVVRFTGQGTEHAHLWDGPACWLDDSELAVDGYGNDEPWLIPGVRIFGAETGAAQRWFPGPRGHLEHDGELFAMDAHDGTTVWSATRRTRLFSDATMTNVRYHPSAQRFVSITDGTISTLRGADTRWNRGRVTELAARIARECTFGDRPVLGDALEAEGCDDAALLAHCHARTEHADRCWVLDRLAT